MVLDPDMELKWAMPSPMLLVFKLKHLWSVNGLGVGFGSIGLGYPIDDSRIAEATAGGTYPTVSPAGGTRYRSNNDEFRRERKEARYYGSMGEDARLPGSQIGRGSLKDQMIYLRHPPLIKEYSKTPNRVNAMCSRALATANRTIYGTFPFEGFCAKGFSDK
ncbi:hypothetical protein Ancab_038610 [Ancistrocladus abbreviatus]